MPDYWAFSRKIQKIIQKNMPINRVNRVIEYDTSGRINSLKIIYQVNYGTYFRVDGDRTNTLEVEGSVDYVKGWIREKLRKLDNGQIKVFRIDFREDKRDWEQEGEIRRQMWDDVNVNAIPHGHNFEEILCTRSQQFNSGVEYKRPPSPSCRIS